jgi:uridine phosphorylase
MRIDKPPDSPVLTPGQVIRLRGVNPDDDGFRFDVAVLCFRGQTASRQVLDAFPVSRIEPDILYGSPAHAGRVGDKRIVILPKVIWGGPVTAILLEELACLGVQTAIGLGAAGSLVSPHHVGRMLIADRALCSDGTSQQYTDQPAVGPAPELFELAVALASQEGEGPIVGMVHTTDALYQEWPARVRQWREAGASFVNLETSPFYAVAAYLGIRAVYLGLVTDYVGDPGRWQHTFWDRPSTTDPSIVKIIQQLVQAGGTRQESYDKRQDCSHG